MCAFIIIIYLLHINHSYKNYINDVKHCLHENTYYALYIENRDKHGTTEFYNIADILKNGVEKDGKMVGMIGDTGHRIEIGGNSFNLLDKNMSIFTPGKTPIGDGNINVEALDSIFSLINNTQVSTCFVLKDKKKQQNISIKTT